MDVLTFDEMKKQLAVECAHIEPEQLYDFIDRWFIGYKDNFVFSMSPSTYIPYAFEHIIDKICMSDTQALLERLRARKLDEVAEETFKVAIYYITSTAIPKEAATHPLKENHNCFVTSFNPETDKCFNSGFTKIPTTLFGRKDISMFNWALPAHKNFAFVYNKDGFRTAAFRYQGKAFLPWQGFEESK